MILSSGAHQSLDYNWPWIGWLDKEKISENKFSKNNIQQFQTLAKKGQSIVKLRIDDHFLEHYGNPI